MSTPKRIIPGDTLGAAFAPYYVADTTTVILGLILTNQTTAPVQVDIQLLPSGAFLGDEFAILKNKVIGPLETLFVVPAMNQVIEAGGSIQAKATGATTILASGVTS